MAYIVHKQIQPTKIFQSHNTEKSSYVQRSCVEIVPVKYVKSGWDEVIHQMSKKRNNLEKKSSRIVNLHNLTKERGTADSRPQSEQKATEIQGQWVS